jgi:hypothetical protein
MEQQKTGTRIERLGEGAAQVARQALEIVIGVLLVDRELYPNDYEDLFHVNW